jgi:hypothetical protein
MNKQGQVIHQHAWEKGDKQMWNMSDAMNLSRWNSCVSKGEKDSTKSQ